MTQWTRRNFAILIPKVAQFIWPPAMYFTSGQVEVFIGETVPGQKFNHEKADTRIVVHVLHALKQGDQTIYVRTVDREVVVILDGVFHDLVSGQHLVDI